MTDQGTRIPQSTQPLGAPDSPPRDASVMSGTMICRANRLFKRFGRFPAGTGAAPQLGRFGSTEPFVFAHSAPESPRRDASVTTRTPPLIFQPSTQRSSQ